MGTLIVHLTTVN